MTKKAPRKKFADGGEIPALAHVMPQYNFRQNPMRPHFGDGKSEGGSGDGAYSSIDQIESGSRGVRSALDTIQGAINGSGSGGSNMNIPVFAYKKGGKVNSPSKRADGVAKRGKTRGKIV